MPGTKILAGNFLISMAVLFGGGSFTKVRQILHMGLGLHFTEHIPQTPMGKYTNHIVKEKEAYFEQSQ